MANERNYAPIIYQCNGVTRDYPFSWKILNKEFVVVTLINAISGEESILNENQYNVDFDDMGGTITTQETYSNEFKIKISRNTSLFQNKRFQTSSGFQAEEIEKALDKVSCEMQELVYEEQVFENDINIEMNATKDIANGANFTANETMETLDTFLDTDETKVSEIETKVTNDVLNNQNLLQAIDNANTAKNTANLAMSTLDTFLDTDETKVSEIEEKVTNDVLNNEDLVNAIDNANSAKDIADEALEKANDAKDISEQAEYIASRAGLTPKGVYNAATNYNKNDFVYVVTDTATTYYISNDDDNVGHDVNNTDYWTEFLRLVSGESVNWGNVQGDIQNQSDLIQKFATKQDVISDLSTIRTNANLVTTKQDVISDLSTIRTNANLVTTKQDVISDLSTIRTNASNVTTKVSKTGDNISGTLGFNNSNSNTPISFRNIADDGYKEIQSICPDGINRITGVRFATYENRNEFQVYGVQKGTNTNKGNLFVGKCDTNGNKSCEFADTKCVDGQWIMSRLVLADSVSFSHNGNAYEYDLSSYLPNDNYTYEVIVSGIGDTTSSSGSYINAYVYSDFLNDDSSYIYLYRCRTRTSSSVQGGGNAIIPVGTGRKLYHSNPSNVTGTFSLYVFGYRRIGTNN